jgi:hypothetical protein
MPFSVAAAYTSICTTFRGKEINEKKDKGCFIITDDKLLMIFFILFLDVEG